MSIISLIGNMSHPFYLLDMVLWANILAPLIKINNCISPSCWFLVIQSQLCQRLSINSASVTIKYIACWLSLASCQPCRICWKYCIFIGQLVSSSESVSLYRSISVRLGFDCKIMSILPLFHDSNWTQFGVVFSCFYLSRLSSLACFTTLSQVRTVADEFFRKTYFCCLL